MAEKIWSASGAEIHGTRNNAIRKTTKTKSQRKSRFTQTSLRKVRKVLLNLQQKRLNEEKQQEVLDTIKKLRQYRSENRFLA